MLQVNISWEVPLDNSNSTKLKRTSFEAVPPQDPYREGYSPISTNKDPHREGYSPISSSRDPNREGYQSVAVPTVTESPGAVQILPPLTTGGDKPDTTGIIFTSLETGGRVSEFPFLTNPIPNPTSLIVPFGPVAIPTSTPKPNSATPSPVDTSPAKASSANSGPTRARQAETSTAKPNLANTSSTKETTAKMTDNATASSNIFGAAIATTAPPSVFQVRKDHPVPRLGVTGSPPIGTNKFYANFFLGGQNSPAYVHPYSLAWAKGQGATSSWGMSISHIEANQRVYGQVLPETGAARYFLSPTGVQSLCLSAVELGSTTSLTTDNLNSHSVNVNLHASAQGDPLITYPMVQGMGLVTAVYKGSTPQIESGILFKTITKSSKGPKPGITKYSITLEDGKVWHVYACSTSGDALDLQVSSSKLAKAAKPFNGFIQVAKDPGDAEAIIDAAAGAYPIGATLSATASGSKGTYTLTFQKAGFSDVKLLMYALPHHVASFDDNTSKAASTAKLQTTTKGMAVGVVADSWTMVEPNMPVSMYLAPWDPATGSKTTLKDSCVSTVSASAVKELSQNVDQQSNQNSMYFSGKALAKFTMLCYTANDLLKNPKLAQSGLTNLKAAFTRFITNKQQYPLYYESAWGGIVSSATYETGNNGADFGNTFYNDHHFHYGYFIYAAAIIGYLDASWLTKENVDYINTMVRDIANPSNTDKYFPVSRNFDWYHGHSWAHGLYETLDGKDQESSSEDALAAYAIKVWGKTIKDANMEARGNLMLSILSRSLNEYYLYSSGNTVQPANFVGNRVAGIMFENKCDHTTYFGGNIEYVQGIHMLPLIPSTKFTRPAAFVKEEWAALFDNGRAEKVDGGWKGILFGNLATVDPQAAWSFFTDKDFDPSWIDGGASLTWYLAYAAAFM
ncbi:Uu.00g122410.m01.CDS01 [Anthostomella pinea]|uniref:glucan endo-1,3-beta-D-glucosidase n=1 Tax=Anthostomella pinea TaxID=933095 RepID=A0AAI8YHJ2_9PEZI|nr:Uu.00g122410.m01.CDS01 [Anthostomella pinea]